VVLFCPVQIDLAVRHRFGALLENFFVPVEQDMQSENSLVERI
jgi:hypothetical protein